MFALTMGDTETGIEVDKMGTEPNKNLRCYLSRIYCSDKQSFKSVCFFSSRSLYKVSPVGGGYAAVEITDRIFARITDIKEFHDTRDFHG